LIKNDQESWGWGEIKKEGKEGGREGEKKEGRERERKEGKRERERKRGREGRKERKGRKEEWKEGKKEKERKKEERKMIMEVKSHEGYMLETFGCWLVWLHLSPKG
jgi:hypothetical protein